MAAKTGPRLAAVWLPGIALVIVLGACVSQEPRPGGPRPAEIVPRADDIGLDLTIDRIDDRIVNVPEAAMIELEPGPRRLGVKAQYKPTSPGALVFGLGVISAIVRETGASVSHQEVYFTAEPGRRYHLNGDMEDGKLELWVVDEQTQTIVSF